MQTTLKTYLILFAGVFALSTSGIFAEISEAPSAVTAFYRLTIAAVVLTPLLLLSPASRREVTQLTTRQWGQILLAGTFLALHYQMWFESLRFTSVSSSIVLVSLQPLFSLALDRFVGKRKVRAAALTGCIIALIGCTVVGAGDFRISGTALFGDLLSFASAGVISMYFFVGESVRKEISAVTYSTFSYYFSGVLLLIYVLARGHALTGYPPSTWGSFLGLALISTICGQFVFNLLLKNIPASAVTMSILGEPIGTCLLACLLLHEVIRTQQLIGFSIIMTGMLIFFCVPERKAPSDR